MLPRRTPKPVQLPDCIKDAVGFDAGSCHSVSRGLDLEITLPNDTPAPGHVGISTYHTPLYNIFVDNLSIVRDIISNECHSVMTQVPLIP